MVYGGPNNGDSGCVRCYSNACRELIRHLCRAMCFHGYSLCSLILQYLQQVALARCFFLRGQS